MAATFFFLLLQFLYFTTLSSSLTFTITNFSQSTFRILSVSNYFNNASIQNNNLVLTTMSNWTTGRATYAPIFHLHDVVSNTLSHFTTHFSFTIDSKNHEPYSDGLAFFIAPVDFPMPETQEGSGLGLVSGPFRFNSTSSLEFVAVEFDTFDNGNMFKDFESDHVGIDVGSVESVTAVKWKSGVLEGKRCEAWIEYNAMSKDLSVVFTGFESNRTVLQSLNYTIDLRKVLPEDVRLGFAAATGKYSQSHVIHSWTFDSKLVFLNERSSTEQGKGSDGYGSENRTGMMVGVGIGIGIGGGVVVVAGVLIGVFLWRRKRGGEGGENRRSAVVGEFERSAVPELSASIANGQNPQLIVIKD